MSDRLRITQTRAGGVLIILLVISLFYGQSSLQNVLAQTDEDIPVADADSFYTPESNTTTHSSLLSSANAYEGFSIQTGLLNNISDIRLDGLIMTVSGNKMVMRNLRAKSDTTELADYLEVTYLIDTNALRLIPTKLLITENLGIYSYKDVLFSKVINASLVMTTPSGSKLQADQLHTIKASATDMFSMSLESGTVFTMKALDPDDTYELQIYYPSGALYETTLKRNGSSWNLIERTVLTSGIYTFKFVPQTKPTVTLTFGFSNNNRSKLLDVVSGSQISGTLTGWGFEYAKYKVNLNSGDLVEVSDPSTGNEVWQYLANSDNRIYHGGSGELLERVPQGGVYYLFVKKLNSDSSFNYSAKVTITADPNRTKYPVLNPVPKQATKTGELFTLQLQAGNAATSTVSIASSDASTSTVQYLVTGLPPNLSVNETSGLISGIPQLAGTFPIQATIRNQFGTDEKRFLIKIEGEDVTPLSVYLPTIIRSK